MNCWAVPGAIVKFAGVTDIETREAEMATLNNPLTDPEAAVTEHCPLAFALNIPELDTVAMFASDVLQAALLVKSCVLPLLYLPTAVNCSL
jgi:hypothetical protein